jgi:hypothetical protein
LGRDSGDGDGDAGGGDDTNILVSLQMFMDPKLPYIPSSLINFVVGRFRLTL